jgi:hypothetical protein
VETGLFQTAREVTINHIVSLAHDQPEWEEGDSIIAASSLLGQHTAQEWAIEANKGKADHVLPERYQRHAHVFSEEAAQCFPPARPDDMVIKLKPGALDTINSKIYPLSHLKVAEWQAFVDKNKKLGWIKETKSPWGVPVFFIHKKDGSFRLVQDYWEVNKWTEHNIYPMPQIKQILEQLDGKMLFRALDIRDGYNNIQVNPED